MKSLELVVSNPETQKVTTTTRIIAENFGKRHGDFIKRLENLECSQEFRQLNFEPSSYINSQGKSQPEYNITRDGFMLLVMGFTGKKAGRIKEQFITAFNTMETKLLFLTGLSPQLQFMIEMELKQQEQEKQFKLVQSSLDHVQDQLNIKKA